MKHWSPHDLTTGMLLEHALVSKERVGKQVSILSRLKHDGQEWQPGTMPWFEVRIAGEELNGNCYPAFPGDAIGPYVEPTEALGQRCAAVLHDQPGAPACGRLARALASGGVGCPEHGRGVPLTPASKSREVIYLCHPLNAPTREGIEANRRAAAKWAAFLATHFNVAPECSWIVLTGEFEENAENRKRGLEIDLALVERCDEVVLVGPRVSEGMKLESEHARKLGKPVANLTGLGMDAETIALAWLPSRELRAIGEGGKP